MSTESLATPVYRRAKTWQICFFALNNSATNLALFLMMQYAYFTQNVLGLSAVVVGVIATSMRVFDGITDPLIAFFVDKTNGRFGRFRPFILGGNLILLACMMAIFNCPLGLSVSGRYLWTTAFYFFYIIGYTMQTIATKAAQSVVTNDPKQRPIFSGVDGFMTQICVAFVPFLITTILANMYSVGAYADKKGLLNPDMWKAAGWIISAISFTFTILAIIGIASKDRPEFYNDLKSPKAHVKDYFEILGHNRPLQMLIISAATDKLGALLVTGTTTYIFANMLLNSSLAGEFSLMLTLPLIVVSFVGMMIARKLGLKRTFLIGTWGSMIFLAIMFIVRPNPNYPWIFLGLYLVQKLISSMANAAVIPMIADCSDYENYRSGRFVPSMISTIFSFIDKMISSASSLIIGFALAAAGVGKIIITPNQPVNDTFNMYMMICFCIVPILGHVASIIAMKWYNLDSKEMVHVQSEIEKRKAEKQTTDKVS
ncbi:MAG: MFS transporter [Ruthenibacterium sp.]